MKSWKELEDIGAELNLDGMVAEEPPKAEARPKKEPLGRLADRVMNSPEAQAERLYREQKAYVERKTVHRKFELEKHLEAEEEKVSAATKEAFDDVFSTYTDHLKKRYQADVRQHTRAVANAVPFIDPVFDQYFKLTPGQFVTIAAYSGEGKSTNAANIAANAVLAGRRAMVISNEERSTDFMDMVACICEGLYHKDFVERTMEPGDQKRLARKVASLLDNKQFISLDEADTNGGTTRDDYIINMLQHLASAKVRPDVVIVDYLTNVYAAGSTTSDNHYFQLDRFLSNMKNLINKLPFPVVMCAQMHSTDKKKGQNGKPAALDTRLIMGGAIFRCSTVVLEVRPDFEQKISTVTIHKNRTYKEKGEITLKFDKGRLKHFDPMGAFQVQIETSQL